MVYWPSRAGTFSDWLSLLFDKYSFNFKVKDAIENCSSGE